MARLAFSFQEEEAGDVKAEAEVVEEDARAVEEEDGAEEEEARTFLA